MRGLSKWISKSYREIVSYMGKEFREYGINMTDYVYLIHISNSEGINQEEIAKHLSISKTAGSKIVKKLMELDLVERKKNMEDKRAFRIYVTDKGRILREELDKKVEEWEDKVLADWTEKEIKDYLLKLENTFEKTNKLNIDWE